MKETLKGNLLFVGGDLSGIQKFIYNVSSKKAAVSLKGRSEYLCQYTREVYDRLTNLSPVKSAGIKDVYCSSGKFYFITSDTAEIREAITQCSKEIESALWKEQQGQLENYIKLLLEWNNKINLIGKSTIDDLWSRHIVDSAQLMKFLSEEDLKNCKCADFGTGAGFPGIVLSILGVKNMTLIEKSIQYFE